MCENVTMSTADNVASSGDDASLARFIIQTVRGPRELKLVRERGNWTVATFDFRDAPEVPSKLPKGAKASSPAPAVPPKAPRGPREKRSGNTSN